MTVMFELPGLKKTDLRMRLSVCPYSRVRQLTISGRIKPTLSETGFTIKERKFGDFHRTVIVPYGTQVRGSRPTRPNGTPYLVLARRCGCLHGRWNSHSPDTRWHACSSRGRSRCPYSLSSSTPNIKNILMILLSNAFCCSISSLALLNAFLQRALWSRLFISNPHLQQLDLYFYCYHCYPNRPTHPYPNSSTDDLFYSLFQYPFSVCIYVYLRSGYLSWCYCITRMYVAMSRVTLSIRTSISRWMGWSLDAHLLSPFSTS